MWPVVFIILGLALAGYVLWARAGRSPRARGWAARGQGSTLDERAVLFFFPAVALFLLALGPLFGYDGNDPSHQWRLAFVPLVILGGVLGLWGGLQLPVPRWYLPRWLRERRPPASRKRS